MHSGNFYWSQILNLIINKYLQDTTICILWHKDVDMKFEIDFATSAIQAFIVIDLENLKDSFEGNVIDFEEKRKKLQTANGSHVAANHLTYKLIHSIETSHCEQMKNNYFENFFKAFIVFEDDIPKFVRSFLIASKYSIWRSIENKFVFAYTKKYANGTAASAAVSQQQTNYFDDDFFRDEPKILIIEHDLTASSKFNLKTNKYVGKRADNPKALYLLDIYDGQSQSFQHNANLFPDKTLDLHGREIILATFDYRPYVAFEYGEGYEYRDIAYDDPKRAFLHIAGTEMQSFKQFCAMYNCTMAINTAEADDWGAAYTNMSGYGALGMVAKGMAEVAIGAMYSWYEDYESLDISVYLTRTGITCVVPKPKRRASWLLPIQPFQTTLWIAVISCLITELLGLMVTLRAEDWFVGGETNNGSWLKSLALGLQATFKLCVSQSHVLSAQTVALRTLLSACFITDIILTSSYGGGLSSILTIPSYTEAADSLERLQSHKLRFAANSEAWVLSIETSDDPRIIEMLERFSIYSDETLTQIAKDDENIGFTIERQPFGHYALGVHLTADVLERMKIMVDDLYFEYSVAFVARLWPMLEHYNRMIYMWHSSGFDKYWEWRSVASYSDMHLQKQVEASMYTNLGDLGPAQLDMSNFIGILAILVLGDIVAFFIFIGELLFYRLHFKYIVT